VILGGAARSHPHAKQQAESLNLEKPATFEPIFSVPGADATDAGWGARKEEFWNQYLACWKVATSEASRSAATRCARIGVEPTARSSTDATWLSRRADGEVDERRGLLEPDLSASGPAREWWLPRSRELDSVGSVHRDNEDCPDRDADALRSCDAPLCAAGAGLLLDHEPLPRPSQHLAAQRLLVALPSKKCSADKSACAPPPWPLRDTQAAAGSSRGPEHDTRPG
jgi:hypothetical protein